MSQTYKVVGLFRSEYFLATCRRPAFRIKKSHI